MDRTQFESVKTLNLDDGEVDMATAISIQLGLLSSCECNVLAAVSRLTEMIQHDAASQEEIRTAGGVRSTVFLLKLSQRAGNQRMAHAASRLLRHLARDNTRNQYEIRTLEAIPCLVDLVVSITRLGDSPHSSGSELAEMTRAAHYW